MPITTSIATECHDRHLEELIAPAARLIAEEAVHLADACEFRVDLALPIR